jgi:hypothetical protein
LGLQVSKLVTEILVLKIRNKIFKNIREIFKISDMAVQSNTDTSQLVLQVFPAGFPKLESLP